MTQSSYGQHFFSETRPPTCAGARTQGSQSCSNSYNGYAGSECGSFDGTLGKMNKEHGTDKRESIPQIPAAPLSVSVRGPNISHNLPHQYSQNQRISVGDIKLGMQPRGQKHEKQKHPIQFGRRIRAPDYARKKKEMRPVMQALTKTHALVMVRCS